MYKKYHYVHNVYKHNMNYYEKLDILRRKQKWCTSCTLYQTMQKPVLTAERKKMMQHLDNYVYQRVGYMTADAWNKSSQYIKFNSQPE